VPCAATTRSSTCVHSPPLTLLHDAPGATDADEDEGARLETHGAQTFQDIEEDQYDFHSYCVRKYTLKAYIECVSCLLPTLHRNTRAD